MLSCIICIVVQNSFKCVFEFCLLANASFCSSILTVTDDVQRKWKKTRINMTEIARMKDKKEEDRYQLLQTQKVFLDAKPRQTLLLSFNKYCVFYFLNNILICCINV